VVLVTGTASGIGWATAERFLSSGDVVVGADLTAAGPEGVAAHRVDVTDPSAVAALVAAVVSEHGRLDVVANVAGVEQFGRAEQISDAEWQHCLAVNLTGPFQVCRAAIPHLRASRGCIVNVASIAGLSGQAYTAAYCASKGGLVLLTKALAVELASDGVRVNCVCPAAVDTPLLSRVAPKIPADADPRMLERMTMLLPGGLAESGQIAEAVAYLASPGAAMITGHALVIDGGSSA
jgi:NAD(P)-dependent dehydrogenase (short-subunit alcohol dehydrogenase family)